MGFVRRTFRSDIDTGGPAVLFEDPSGEVEFEVLREGIDPEPEDETETVGLDPELAGKSNEEINSAFAKLRDQGAAVGGQNQQLNETLGALNRTLGQTPAGPQSAPVPTPEVEVALPDEDEFVRDPVGASNKLIEARVAKERKEVAGALAQQAQVNLTLRMQLLRDSDPYFAKYEKEIQTELNALTPAARLNPEALDFVVGKVKSQPKVQSEIIQAEVAKALAKEKGESNGSRGAAAPTTHVEGASTGAPVPTAKKRVTLSIAEMNEARNLGMAVPDQHGDIDYSDYIRHVVLPKRAETTGRRVSV